MIVLFVAALHLVGAAALLHPQHQASSARASSAPPFPYGFALGSSTARVPLGDPLQYHGVVALPPGLGQARDEGRAAEPFCQGVALACAVAPLAARRARGLMGGSFLASWLGTTMAFFTSLHGDPGLAHLCLALGLLPRLCAALIFWPGFHSDRACASRALPSASFVQKPVENLFFRFLVDGTLSSLSGESGWVSRASPSPGDINRSIFHPGLRSASPAVFFARSEFFAAVWDSTPTTLSSTLWVRSFFSRIAPGLSASTFFVDIDRPVSRSVSPTGSGALPSAERPVFLATTATTLSTLWAQFLMVDYCFNKRGKHYNAFRR